MPLKGPNAFTFAIPLYTVCHCLLLPPIDLHTLRSPSSYSVHTLSTLCVVQALKSAYFKNQP